MWLTKKLVEVFGATEFWLRFLSSIASIVALLLVPYLASQLLKSRFARVLLVFAFALHPALIDLSKEFKPYSLEVLVHLLPIILYLRYRQTSRARYLYGLLALLPVAFLFAYNLAFAYPGVLLLALWKSWQAPRRWRAVTATLASAVACLAVIATVYTLLLSNVKTRKTESYWGSKYDVFYVQEPSRSRASWLVEQYNDVAALPGLRRILWKPPARLNAGFVAHWQSADRLAWVFAHFLGAYVLARRRRWDLMLLLFLPLLTLVVVNLAGYWPLGAARMNLFACAYVLPIAAIGLDGLVGLSRARTWITASVVLSLSVLPGFAFGFDWHRHKRTWTRDHYARVILERLRSLREQHLKADPTRPRERVLLDTHSWHPFRFYTAYHPAFAGDSFYARNFRNERGISRKLPRVLRREKQPVWVIASKELDATRAYVAGAGNILFEERVHDEHLILLVARK
jgi:4-amino-4-deoxy-L-arabinose transferase-like glycosyltransferase